MALITDATIPGKFWDKGGALHNVQHPDYGATGDGATDDTDAIQAAIEDADAGSTIYVPPGTYRVTGLAVTKKLTFAGANSRQSKIELVTAADAIAINVSVDEVDFRDLAFETTGSKGDGNNTVGLFFDDGGGSIGYNEVRRCYFNGFSRAGIEYANCIYINLIALRGIGNARTIYLRSARGSAGTTFNILGLYATGDTGIELSSTGRGEIIGATLESIDIGIKMTSSPNVTIVQPYFEAVTTADIQSEDAGHTIIGRGSTGAGDSNSWINSSTDGRTISQLQRGGLTARRWTHFYESGRNSRNIDPYVHVQGNIARYADGLLYDTQRMIALAAPNNLLDMRGWTGPGVGFRGNERAVNWTVTGGGSQTMRQDLSLAADDYLFLCAVEVKSDNLAADPTVQMFGEATGDVVDSFSFGTSNGTKQKLIYFPWTLGGGQTVRVLIQANVAAGDTLDVNMWPMMFSTSGAVDNTADWPGPFDEAAWNAARMAFMFSGMYDSQDILNFGYKTVWSTGRPNSGTWRKGDKAMNSDPAPGEYIGWICTSGGTNGGTWRGFGLIET